MSSVHPLAAHNRVATTAAAAVATGLLTSAHHIFRLGPEVLIAAVVVTALPYALLRWYRASGRNAVLGAATAVNVLVFLWFGFLDGFLDHVLKAVGLENVTILPGGEADVVATYYALWSPAAGDAFYEVTGVLTFVASVATLVLNILLVRAARRAARVHTPMRTPAGTRGAAEGARGQVTVAAGRHRR